MSLMAYEGKWKDVFMFLSEAVKEQTQIRDYISGEAMIKGFLLAYLNITNSYIVNSEKELNKGVADLWLEPIAIPNSEIRYSYLIELKYYKRSEEKEITNKLESIIKTATTQLKKYEKDAVIIQEKAKTHVKKLILVYNAWELIHLEEINF